MIKILLIGHDPSHSGIEGYTIFLFESLKSMLSSGVTLLMSNDDLIHPLKRDMLMPIYAVLSFLNDLKFTYEIPKENALFHITNATLSTVINIRNLHPSIVTVHDMFPFALRYERARAWSGIGALYAYAMRESMESLMEADKIICVSKSTEHTLLHLLDVNPSDVRVVHYGVDHELFKPNDKAEYRKRLNLPLDKPIVLNVGSEEPRKNVETLIKAFYRLQKDLPNAVLVRVGAKTNGIQKLIDSLGLEGKVFYFKTSLGEVAHYYEAADLLVFPSYYEGFGNPPLEAMASGLPVIASNRTSIPEVVGDAGILLDPFDVEGFAYWMREVLTDEDLREKLGRKGLERSTMFSWEKCAKETLEVYKKAQGES